LVTISARCVISIYSAEHNQFLLISILGGAQKNATYMLDVGQAIEQTQKRLTTITAVKDGHVEHCVHTVKH